MGKMEKRLLRIINDTVEKEEWKIDELDSDLSLTIDLGLDSLALAELTVKIEDEFGVDVFEDGIVDTISEVEDKLKRKE